MTPTEEISSAVKKLSGLLDELPGEWGDRPWHIDECVENDCPCIVAQGVTGGSYEDPGTAEPFSVSR